MLVTPPGTMYREHMREVNDGDSIELPGRRGIWKALIWAVGVLLFTGAIYLAQRGDWAGTERSPAGDGSLVATSGVDVSRVPRVGSGELRYGSQDSADHTIAADPNVGDDEVLADTTVFGALDHPRRLIGRQVTIHNVNLQRRTNDVAFWVGQADRRLLVVFDRDTRQAGERLTGMPATHPVPDGREGAHLSLTGTIEPLPEPEGMASWGLTTRERAEAANAGVYVSASRVQR